jgi:hypothetical protein
LNRLACFFAVTVLLSTLLLSSTLSPATGLNSVNIFPPGEKPYGLTYADHVKNFWKWLLSIPAVDNPRNDPTGIKCATGQSNTNSSVFYLAPGEGSVQRTCEIPAGKGLFISVMQGEDSQKEDPTASTQDLNTSVTSDQNSVDSLYLKIGDKEYSYQDLLKYRTNTGVFDVVFADNGIFGVRQGGPSKAVADGFYVITEPLAKGTYPVHFKSSLHCTGTGCVETSFAQDISYTIIAK